VATGFISSATTIFPAKENVIVDMVFIRLDGAFCLLAAIFLAKRQAVLDVGGTQFAECLNVKSSEEHGCTKS